MKLHVQYLPLAIPCVVFATIAITFYMSYVKYRHVTYIVPYISDTGTFPPESCVFGQALNIASVLTAITLYLKYLQVNEIFQKHHIEERYRLNKTALAVGLVSSTGMNLVANFQETNALIFHWFAAILAFGGGSLYISLQSVLYVKISPVIGQRRVTMFRIVLAAVSSLAFLVFAVAGFLANGHYRGDDMTKWTRDDGGYEIHQISTCAEWICAANLMLYIGLLRKEFADIEITPIVISLTHNSDTANTSC